MCFFWAKGLSAKDIYNEMLSVYGGKCLSRKTVHNWVEKFSQGRSNVADDGRPFAEVAETTAKRILFSGFRSTGKAMGLVYQCWWRIRRQIKVSILQFRISHVLRFISICDLFADSPSYKRIKLPLQTNQLFQYFLIYSCLGFREFSLLSQITCCIQLA
jgi:hypothetical protein